MAKENFYHDASKVKYLNMIRSGGAKRNARGEIIKDAIFQKRKCNPVAHIHPSRTWFNNTQVISQNELEVMRHSTDKKSVYHILLKQGKVPYALLEPESGKKKISKEFSKIIGKSCNRKKPKLCFDTVEQLIDIKKEKIINLKENADKISNKLDTNPKDGHKGAYLKGQSKRIWNELYKVMDSSDVIIHVLDARDPLGTLCPAVDKYIQNAKHKHLIYVLNKVDLIPTGVTARWLSFLSKKRPTLAFHSSSLNNFYGKTTLTNLLRQFASLHKEKKEISVGFIGYPNVGKSSIINTLRSKKVCSVAPVPGQTRVWQYITLSNRVYLIDCPGIVPFSDGNDAVLKGAIRIENIEEPDIYIDSVIAKAKDGVEDLYGIKITETCDFLEKLAKKHGRLLKNGEPDIMSISKRVLHDFCSGKIKYFIEPPVLKDENN